MRLILPSYSNKFHFIEVSEAHQQQLPTNIKDSILIERYTLPEMAAIWEPENKFDIWLQIEILACEAMAMRKEIPQSAVDEIKKKARFDVDRIDEIVDAGEGSAPYCVDGDVAEEAFNHIEPGRAGGCEVNVEARMLLQPRLHRCVFVC